MDRFRRPLLLTVLMLGLILPLSSSQAGGYTFVQVWRLERDLEKWVGKKVTFTDKLAVFYPKAKAGHVFFDTVHFACALPAGDSDGSQYLKDLHAKALTAYSDLRKEMETAKGDEARSRVVWKIYKRWKNKPIVTCFGTVSRKKIWGEVNPDAEGSGVVSERIIIVCDRVEKPRQRWYDEIK